MKLGRRCTLCGGRLDHSLRCTECGLDNTKNDSMYKNMVNQNECKNQPLTHVHEEAKPNKSYGKVKKSSKKKGGAVGAVITVIVLLYTVIPTVFNLVQDFCYGMEEEVLPDDFFITEEDYDYEYWLSTGFHEAGVHVPIGWCEVEVESGEWADLIIYSFDEDMTFIGKEYFYLSSSESAEFYLDEGDFLMVEAVDDLLETSVWLHTDSTDFIESVVPEAEDSYLISGEKIVGEDFKAGVYDIIYVPESLGESGVVSLWVKNPYGDEEILITDLYFECHEDNFYFVEDDMYGYYANVPLTAGSVVVVDGNLENIYLCPSYETSQKTYDITWGME